MWTRTGHTDGTRGSLTRASCVPEEGSPSSERAHGQPAGGAGTGRMGLEGAGCPCGRSFYFRVGRWGWGVVYVLEEEDQM